MSMVRACQAQQVDDQGDDFDLASVFLAVSLFFAVSQRCSRCAGSGSRCSARRGCWSFRVCSPSARARARARARAKSDTSSSLMGFGPTVGPSPTPHWQPGRRSPLPGLFGTRIIANISAESPIEQDYAENVGRLFRAERAHFGHRWIPGLPVEGGQPGVARPSLSIGCESAADRVLADIGDEPHLNMERFRSSLMVDAVRRNMCRPQPMPSSPAQVRHVCM